MGGVAVRQAAVQGVEQAERVPAAGRAGFCRSHGAAVGGPGASGGGVCVVRGRDDGVDDARPRGRVHAAAVGPVRPDRPHPDAAGRAGAGDGHRGGGGCADAGAGAAQRSRAGAVDGGRHAAVEQPAGTDAGV